MYKLGRFLGNLFVLGLYSFLFTDAFFNIRDGKTVIYDFIGFVLLVLARDLTRRLSGIYQALEFIALSIYEDKNREEKINQAFEDLTKDL